MNLRNTILLIAFSTVLPLRQLLAQTFTFAQLTGSPVNTAGWNLSGNASVGNTPVGTGNSEVILTDAASGKTGGIFYNQAINLAVCKKWYAEFDFRIFDGVPGGDGLTFCYLNNPPVGSVTGGGLGIPPNADGLKICFDTYKNCGNDAAPKIEIRWGTVYDECNGQPTANNNNGTMGFIHSNTYNHALIEYDQGNIKVSVNGTLYITGNQVFNFPGYFGFTAGTGLYYDRHSIKNVSIYTEMPPSEAGNPVALCPKDTVRLGAGAIAGQVYKWTPTTGLSDPNIANPTVTLDNTTASQIIRRYYVQTEFATVPGCASKDSVDIVVRVKPKVDFSFTGLCLPDAKVQFTPAVTIGGSLPATFLYKWIFGDPAATVLNPDTSILPAPLHMYTSAGPFTVNLKAVSSEGCAADTSKIVTGFSQRPVPLITSADSLCAENTIAFTDGSTPGSGTLTNWYWTFGDTDDSFAQNPSKKYDIPGNYLVKLTVRNSAGCNSLDSARKTIKVKPRPVAFFGATPSYCVNIATSFTNNSYTQANGSPIVSYNWTFGDGNTSAQVSPTHTFTTGGNYTVLLKVTDSFGCTDTISYPQVVYPPMDINILAAPVCLGTPTQFYMRITPPGYDTTNINFKWDFNDPLNTLNNDTSIQKAPQYLYPAAGNYTISLRVLNRWGCYTTVTKPVVVDAAPQFRFTVNKTLPLCSNLPLLLQYQTSGTATPPAKISLYWDAATVNADSTVDNSPVSGKTYTWQYAVPQTNRDYIIRMKGVNSTGCVAEFKDTVRLLRVPDVNFAPIPGVCLDVPAFALATPAESAGLPGAGIFIGKGLTPAGTFSPAVAGAGTHNIRYAFAAANGCLDTATTTISVFALPNASAGSDKVVLEGGSVVLDGSSTGTIDDVLWTPATFLNRADTLKPKASPPDDIRYHLEVTTTEGCSDTASVFIKVLKALEIPNAFSPNGDGINDTWIIPYLSSYADCSVEVYDRFGQLAFKSTGYSTPWNGGKNGFYVPAGTYYYIINPKNGSPVRKGSVTLLR